MTPTREQVIEWAKASNILQPDDLLETNQWRQDTIRELERFATLAYSAGRAQGLREAREVCEARAIEMAGFTEEEHASQELAAAIKQLEGK